MVSKILIAGFKGENNSSKILLDKLSSPPELEKLYLENDFGKCAAQIIDYFKNNTYRHVIAVGQKPLIKSIYIEEYGRMCGHKYKTTFQIEPLVRVLTAKGYKIRRSENAGKYLCNHVYATGLKYIEEERLGIEYLFVHIPAIKNLTNINVLVGSLEQYIAEVNNYARCR